MAAQEGLPIPELINKHGDHCSFALWPLIDERKKAKYGVGDMTRLKNVREDDINKECVIVGLNPSKSLEGNPKLSNFHNGSPTSQDYKIRHATQGTEAEGAYMTDLLKNTVEIDSKKIPTNKDHSEVKKCLEIFKQEIKDLGSINPIIICLGNKVYKILSDLKHEYRIYKVPHHASNFSKEMIKEKFINIFENK